MRPSYQKLKTMVNRQKDQKIRTRIFQVRKERIETGVSVEAQKGKHVSFERKSGECHQWKAKGQCTNGDACSFRHDDSERGKVAQSSSLAPRPQTQSDRKSSLKGESLRGRSLSGRGSRRPERHFFEGNCTNPPCCAWHPPVCQNDNTE